MIELPGNPLLNLPVVYCQNSDEAELLNIWYHFPVVSGPDLIVTEKPLNGRQIILGLTENTTDLQALIGCSIERAIDNRMSVDSLHRRFLHQWFYTDRPASIATYKDRYVIYTDETHFKTIITRKMIDVEDRFIRYSLWLSLQNEWLSLAARIVRYLIYKEEYFTIPDIDDEVKKLIGNQSKHFA